MKKTVVSIVGLLLSILIAGLLLSGCGDESGISNENIFQEKLYSKAQTQMLTQLKAPSTAEFSPTFDVQKFVLKKDPDNILNVCGKEVPIDKDLPEKYQNDDYEKYYEVSFWVDAENSYGAMLRTKYTCLIDSFDNVLCQTTEDSEFVKETICS